MFIRLISGVLAFLGFAAGKTLKRGRIQNSYRQPQLPQQLPHYPHYLQRDLHPGPHQQHQEIVGADRKTKEFLIHKGNKEVGRGWFYSENKIKEIKEK